MPKLNFNAINIENNQNKVTSITGISDESDDTQYPSAKAVNDFVMQKLSTIPTNQDNYIIESATTTINDCTWMYKKYANGLIECFGNYICQVNLVTPVGGMMSSSALSVTYPFTFKTKPYEIIQGTLTGGNINTFVSIIGSNSTTRSANFKLLSFSEAAGSPEATFSIHVVGTII